MSNERINTPGDDHGDVGRADAPRSTLPTRHVSAGRTLGGPDVSPAIQAAQLQTRWARDWGMLLRTARQVAGLSLVDLSERTGLSKGYLSKLEASREGARNPSRDTLVALARALPSFRPLAYTLEPTTALDAAANQAFAVEPSAAPTGPSLAFAEAMPRPLALFIGRTEAAAAQAASSEIDDEDTADEAPPPIHLGWRELELLVALLAL